jgi:hypothetical protein
MSRLIRRIFGRSSKKNFSPRPRSARPVRTVAGLKTRLLLQPLEERAVPTAYTVNSLADTNTGSGTAGTLRYCITQADADVATPHTIDLTGVSGTITLTSALPTLTKDMTISGPGASSLTISGANLYRIFAQTTPNFGISGVTLSGGRVTGSGAAINQGTTGNENLMITNTVITGCSASSYAGAIYNDYGGTITITGSTIQNCTAGASGGAFRENAGTAVTHLNITNSQLLNNKAGTSGGALSFGYPGVLSIDHSTLAGNSAATLGGGVYFKGNSTGVTINASTIANNTGTTGGGIVMFFSTAPLTVTSSTITGNVGTTGGGIAVSGYSSAVILDNSIVSGNHGPATSPDISSAYTVNSTYNAIGSTTGFTYTPGTGDLSPADSTPTALKLGALAPKSGPNGTFQVIPVGFGSTAINAGDPSLFGTTDQLGNTRPQDTNGGNTSPDMGSFERVPAPVAAATVHDVMSAAEPATYTFTVTYVDNVNINTGSIASSNVSVSGNLAAGGTVNPTVALVGFDASNPQSVIATYSFSAPGGAWVPADNGAYTVTMNANQVSDAHGYVPAGTIGSFEVLVPQTFTVNSTADNGTGTLRAAIIAANADTSGATDTIDMTGVTGTISLLTALPTIASPVTITGPGAGSLTVNRSTGTFRIFTTGVNLAVGTNTVTMTGFTVSGGNSGPGTGIDETAGSLTLSNMTVTGNSGSGAAVNNASTGALTITNSRILNNTSTGSGGGVANASSGVVTLTGDTIQGNSTSGAGGGLYVGAAATVAVSNSNILNNTAGGNGGGIDVPNAGVGLTISRTTIAGNVSSATTGGGGGLYFDGTPSAAGVSISNSTFANNRANDGGGILWVFSFGTQFKVTSTTVSGNSSVTGNPNVGEGGGGIDMRSGSGTITLDNSIVSGNATLSANGSADMSTAATATIAAVYSALGTSAGYNLTDLGGLLTGANATPAALNMGPFTTFTGPNGSYQMFPIRGTSTALDTGDPAQAGPGATDQLGNARPGNTTGFNTNPDMGSFERQAVPDALATTHNVTQASPAEPVTYTFTVTYYSTTPTGANINTATLDSNDVSVLVPTGVLPVTVSYVSVDASDPYAVVATYQFTAPGGSWGIEDYGNYTVNVNANQVADTNNVPVAAGLVGGFSVVIPRQFVITTTADSGVGSLRDAITTVNQDAAQSLPDQITFSNTTAGGATNFYDGTQHTISLLTALPALTDPATITGPGAAFLTVNRSTGSIRIFNANAGTGNTLSMSGFTVSGGNSGTGAGINVTTGNLSLNNMVISGNSTTSQGGGIYSASTGTITIANSVLQNNTSAGGPAIYNSSAASLTITGSQIQNNRSTNNGAAIFNAWQLRLTGDTIQGNSGSSTGVIYNAATNSVPTTISNTVIQGNTANGAAFYNASSSPVTMTNSQILNNSSTGNGGGMYNSAGAVTLTGDTLSGNSTSSMGGGLFMSSGTLSVNGTTIANNTSSGVGGGLYYSSTAATGMTVANSSITGNWAKTPTGGGGGIYFTGITPATGTSVTNTTIANNLAVNGAGLQVFGLNGTLNLTSDTIVGNTATNANVMPGLGGGGIGLRTTTTTAGASANINLDNTIVASNLAVNEYNDIATVPPSAPTVTTTFTAVYSAIGTMAGFKLTDLGGNITGLTNALLGPVGSNGAMTPLAGSPVVDAGDPGLAGTTDQVGTTRPSSAVDIGAVERVANTLSASATVSNVLTLTAAGNPTYQFTVTYADNVNINTSSIDASDVTIGVPAGVTAPTVSVANVNSSNPNKVVVTYEFTAPGGSWSLADAGSYTVNMGANQVTDANGSVPAGTLAKFVVAPPQTFTVTATTDTGTGSGASGDLRYCITQANAVANANLFSPVPEVIVFSNTTAGGALNFYDGTAHTITLVTTAALPTVVGNLTVNGPGSGFLTIARAGGSFQILPISNATGSIGVNLSGMTLSGAVNASGGAAIVDTNAAALTLTDVTIQNNSTSSVGGAISVPSANTAVTLTNSTLQTNTSASAGGGAIYFGGGGALSMTNSSIQGNRTSGAGGAVYVGTGTNTYFTIAQSTIANNSSANGGGGMRLASGSSVTLDRSTLSGNTSGFGGGGGVYFTGTIGGKGFKIVNSTIANNTAANTNGSGGGLFFTGSMLGQVNVVSSTITGNSAGSTSTTYGTGGGGIALASASTGAGAYSTIALDNSIVSGNSATAANGNPDISATQTGIVMVTADYSAIGSTNGFNATDLGGNLYGANLMLGSLSANGGPTQTVPLNIGSPAIDAGDPSQGGTGFADQRGITRPQGAGVDIGAFEWAPNPPTASAPVGGFTNVTDANASTSNPYQFTVTYADQTAMLYSSINNNSNAITLTTPAGVAPVTVTFVSATPTNNAASITATYQFTVPGGWNPADNGTYTVSVNANQVQDTANLYVQPAVLGGFTVAMAYTGANALVVTNTGDTGTGSGLSGDLRYVLTKAAQVLGTSAPNQIKFSNSTAGGNTNFYDGTAHTIAVNSALPAIPDNVTITGPGRTVLTVARSAAAPAFGMVNLTGPAGQTVGLSGFTISGGSATAPTAAGGIAMTAQSLTLTDMGVANNAATQAAGGIGEFGNGSLTLNNCTVSGNSGMNGGGVYVLQGTTATVSITGSTIANNVAAGTGGSQGGGIDIVGHGPVTITNSTIANNSAPFGGGIALFLGNANLAITNSTLSGNSAGTGGGAVYFNGTGAFSITNSTIANNTAAGAVAYGGGAIDLTSAGAAVTLTSDTLTGNSATGNGGAINFPAGTGVMTIDNSILAGNTAASGPEIFTGTSQSAAVSYSAIDNLSGFTLVNNSNNLSVANSSPAALALQLLANATGPNGTFAVIGLGVGSTAIDAGDPAQGSGHTDELGTPRPQGAGVDIGAVESVVAAPPPQVSSIVVGDGTAERSEVRQIVVTFDSAVTFTGGNGNAAAAFQLLHTTYGGTVFNTLVNNLQAAVTTNGNGETVVTITFTTTGNAATEVDPLSVQSTAGGPTTPSLGDGKFQLTVLASNVSGPGGALAGNGTTAGTDFVTPAETAGTATGLHLWRLFGDSTGEGIDDLTDLTAFRNTYNAALGNASYLNYMDADNDGVIDLDDLTAFRNRYNHSV